MSDLVKVFTDAAKLTITSEGGRFYMTYQIRSGVEAVRRAVLEEAARFVELVDDEPGPYEEQGNLLADAFNEWPARTSMSIRLHARDKLLAQFIRALAERAP